MKPHERIKRIKLLIREAKFHREYYKVDRLKFLLKQAKKLLTV